MKRSSKKNYKKIRAKKGRRFLLRRVFKYLDITMKILGVIIAVLLIIYFLVKSTYFEIKNVSVNGTKTFVSETELANLVGQQAFGDNILTFNERYIEGILLERFQGASKITIAKDYPDTLVVSVVERVPLALVTNPKAQDYFMVDNQGYVLGIVDEERTNLPRITYNKELQVGYFIDKDLVPLYLELLSSLDEATLSASSVSVSNRHLKFYLNDGVEIYLGREKSIEDSVLVLSELIKKLDIEAKNPKKIDLRYDKVVVEYLEDVSEEEQQDDAS